MACFASVSPTHLLYNCSQARNAAAFAASPPHAAISPRFQGFA